jgi:hypothetical protein
MVGAGNKYIVMIVDFVNGKRKRGNRDISY